MKQLKSSLRDLREIFERSITVRDIVEPLTSFDDNCSAENVKKFMRDRDYDVVGVRKDGLIAGYARKSELAGGYLGDYLISFNEKFPETTSLINILESFRNLERIFVLVFGQVAGIVTRGDLQKQPVRMWLFGLISLIEMQLLLIIREYYPGDEWKDKIKENRLKKAEEEFSKLQGKSAAIDLADCLQFCDKRDIILKTRDIMVKLNFDSNKLERLLKHLENLRNDLAHAQDIITGNWPGIIEFSGEAEKFLRKCEEY